MSVLAAAAVATAAATAAAAHPSAPSPLAAPWAAPGVGLECQAKLNAFCNDPEKDGPHNDGAYNASRAVAWRCYSHGCLNPTTHRFDPQVAGPPSGPSRLPNATACNEATDVGPGALQAICAACAGTTEGVSRGQCLPAPHILRGAPSRLPIQREGAARFTVTGNFSGATAAATCRVSDQK